jgi:CTP synthase
MGGVCTDDGAETDLDLGHYERFTHAKLTRDNNVTTARYIFPDLQREAGIIGQDRPGGASYYRQIKASIQRWQTGRPDIVIVEIGGRLRY